MTALSLASVLLLMSYLNLANTQTIWASACGTSPNPAVTKFCSMITEAGAQTDFNRTSPGVFYTAFMPNNDRLDAAKSVLGWSQLSPTDKKTFILYHKIEAASNAGSIKGTTGSWDSFLAVTAGMPGVYGQARIFTYEQGGSRFWFKNATNMFINQAIIVQRDIDAVNGVYHIISDMLNAPGYAQSIRHFLPFNSSLSTSNSLWQNIVQTYPDNLAKYIDLSALSGAVQMYSTLFVPDNNAWSSIPQTMMNNLTATPSFLTSVLGSHYAPNQLLFINPSLPTSTIPFYCGFPVSDLKPTRKVNGLSDAQISVLPSGNMFVTSGGVTARIIQPNIPLAQSVVHIIDRPLGVVYQTKRTILNTKAPDFLKMCDTIPECSALVDSPRIQTVFAFKQGDNLKALSPADKLTYLKIHFLTTTIYMAGMKNYTNLSTVDNTGSIRFRNMLDGRVYVEGRLNNSAFGRVQLVDSDNPAVDGVVHTVDSAIGYPISDIKTFLTADGRYSTFLSYDLFATLQSEYTSYGVTYTYFIPTNDALAKMSSDTNGSSLLQNSATRNLVLRRSIFPNYIVLDDLTPGITYPTATANYGWNKEQITLQVASIGGTTIATLTSGSIKVTVDAFDGGYRTQENHIVYPLSSAMYLASDTSTQACSYPWCAATISATCPLYLIVLILIAELLMNHVL